MYFKLTEYVQINCCLSVRDPVLVRRNNTSVGGISRVKGSFNRQSGGLGGGDYNSRVNYVVNIGERCDVTTVFLPGDCVQLLGDTTGYTREGSVRACFYFFVDWDDICWECNCEEYDLINTRNRYDFNDLVDAASYSFCFHHYMRYFSSELRNVHVNSR